MSYYRLKQTDYDAEFSYSEIKQVSMEMQSHTTKTVVDVFPNPVKGDQFFVKMYEGILGKETLVMLYDPLGREVYSKLIIQEDGQTISTLDLTGQMTPDIYIVTGSSDNSIFRNKLIVKK